MTADYNDATAGLLSHAEDLGVWLAIWFAGDDSQPDAHARRCASDAVDAIDAAIRELHGVRARLVGEIRQSDDASAAWNDALLARLRGDQR